MNKLESYVKEDGAIMEEYLYRDGEIPGVVFFHFPKINKKISTMMNKLPSGKMNVKNGFFIALNEQVLMENRGMFLHFMGSVLATMELLQILEAPDAVIFCAEGWASTALDKKGKIVRPSTDPKAKDVFIVSGISKEGEIKLSVKEKTLEMVKVNGQKALKPKLIELSDTTPGEAASPLLEEFFTSYHKSIEELKKEDGWKVFEKMAEDDPVDAFRQGIAAAITMTRNHVALHR